MAYRIAILALCLCVCSVHLAVAQYDVDETPSQIEIEGADTFPLLLVQPGTELRLVCLQHDGQVTEWRRDKTRLTSGEGYYTLPELRLADNVYKHELIVTKAKPEHSGSYFCQQKKRPERSAVQQIIVPAFEVTPGLSRRDGDTAVLACKVTNFAAYESLRWYRNDQPITDSVVADGEKPKYEVSNLNLTLTVNKVVFADVGLYTCLFKQGTRNLSATVELQAIPRIKNSDVASKNLVEDDPLVLECKTWGFPDVSVRWSRDGAELNTSDSRVQFLNYTDETTGTVLGAKLRIEKMTFDDHAEYECYAFNDAGNSTHTVLVRVKDKLAALWPFLGIVAEVAILCTIIFIYEKKRAKKLEEEEAREEADQLTNSNDHKAKDSDDLRQRK